MENADLESQTTELARILRTNENIVKVLKGLEALKLGDYYLAGGCISQTVWNYLHGFSSEANIKDYDVVYYNKDESHETEDVITQIANKQFSQLSISMELVNQARVYTWYEERNGTPAPYYGSAAEGINSWPVTVCCVGVRMEGGRLKVYAPYGLHDLFGLVIRPNKTVAPEKVYDAKLARWTKVWPKLVVIPWRETR